jgi:hypothetical protein
MSPEVNGANNFTVDADSRLTLRDPTNNREFATENVIWPYGQQRRARMAWNLEQWSL